MQTSGFATLANVLASLPCAFQIPVLLLVSERGTLGEFNIGQAMVWRTMRPVLESLGMEHHTITRLDECAFICDRTIKQAWPRSARRVDPFAAAHRREGPRRGKGEADGDAERRHRRRRTTAQGVMHRADLMRRLVARLSAARPSSAGIGNTNFDLWAAGHRAQNFYMLGSMGLAVPIALGVALAQPDRKVFALEGDGSLLMQLGCLSTVAALAPRNLAVLVFDNGAYQITGGQPTPAAASGADLMAVARGCGLAAARLGRRRGGFRAHARRVPRGGRPARDRPQA